MLHNIPSSFRVVESLLTDIRLMYERSQVERYAVLIYETDGFDKCSHLLQNTKNFKCLTISRITVFIFALSKPPIKYTICLLLKYYNRISACLFRKKYQFYI